MQLRNHTSMARKMTKQTNKFMFSASCFWFLQIDEGFSVGIIDFTTGDLGTRGTSEIRLEEARLAGDYMGLSVRENLGFKDGFFKSKNRKII